MAQPPLLGQQQVAELVPVTHSCRHTVRWHFFALPGLNRLKAAALPCPRCGGEAPMPGPCDAIFYPTGVAHCHKGPCPDVAPDVQRWLHHVGARIA